MRNIRKIVASLDCDDVILHTAEHSFNAYNNEYNANLRLADYYTEEDRDGVPYHIASKRMDDLLKAGLNADLEPDEETIEYIHRMARDGHELHVVTGRQSYQKKETNRMLNKYFPGIFASVEYTNMHASGDYEHLKRTKFEVFQKLGITTHVDDLFLHCKDAVRAGAELAILYGETPWNKGEVPTDKIVRRIGMKAVYEEITDLALRAAA